MTDDYLSILRQALDKMLEQKAGLEMQKAQTEMRLSALNKTIGHVEEALKSSSGPGEVINPRPISRRRRLHPGTLLPVHLSHMTLEDALVHLARRNEGILNSYDVHPILVEANLLKGSSGTRSTRLHETLVNSDHFEPLDKRGRWKLTTYQPGDEHSLI